MLKHYLKDLPGSCFAVSSCPTRPEVLLVQMDSPHGEQVRVFLDKEETILLITLLNEKLKLLKP
jgi:hypothetical protein